MRRYISILKIILFLTATITFASTGSAHDGSVPASFDLCSTYNIEGTSKVFTRESMYEHVNGEAELLKRYGATRLIYAAFYSEKGDSITVDLIDLVKSENSFGLYRLYSGCDEEIEEIRRPGFMISISGTTAFAFNGNFFLRIYAFNDKEKCDNFLERVAEIIFSKIEVPEPFPAVASVIEKFSKKKCDIAYHPDEVDFEREAGPGYRWKDPENREFFLRILESVKEAKRFSERISQHEEITFALSGNIVAWTDGKGEERGKYLLKVLGDLKSVTHSAK